MASTVSTTVHKYFDQVAQIFTARDFDPFKE